MSRKRRWQQMIYVLTPFFMLLLCLGFINFVPRLTVPGSQPESAPPANGTAVTTTVSPIASASSTPTATPFPSPTLPSSTATLPPGAAITLLGPPDASQFRRLDTISFYADWPVMLVEPQYLALYVRFDGQPPTLLGMLAEPNIGQRYRWQLNLGEMADTAVSLEWWVQLETDSGSPPLLTGASRQVAILP